jgi:carbon storage regulator
VLVLSRKKSEVIVVGDSDAQPANIRIVVLEIGKRFVTLGIEAPDSVPVHRMEVWERIQSD